MPPGSGSVTGPEAAPDIRLEWGLQGLEALRGQCDHLVIVDVLSFTTCVDIALTRGARVLPWRWYNETAAVFARERGARLAVRREQMRGGELSLAPSSMLELAAGESVVLPSPNGATLSVAARGSGQGAGQIWAACLRNAGALASHLKRIGGTVAVVPAGESWPDGSLRVALEDHLAAGALVARLRGRASPEADAARAVFNTLRSALARQVSASQSGRELIERGFADDVRLACELDCSGTLCRLVGDAYVAVEA